jgi:hypothetical protein
VADARDVNRIEPVIIVGFRHRAGERLQRLRQCAGPAWMAGTVCPGDVKSRGPDTRKSVEHDAGCGVSVIGAVLWNWRGCGRFGRELRLAFADGRRCWHRESPPERKRVAPLWFDYADRGCRQHKTRATIRAATREGDDGHCRRPEGDGNAGQLFGRDAGRASRRLGRSPWEPYRSGSIARRRAHTVRLRCSSPVRCLATMPWKYPPGEVLKWSASWSRRSREPL